MPAPDSYLRGFGIHKGLELNGFTLRFIHIEHHKIVLFHEYSYPTELDWEWSGSRKPTVDDVQSLFNSLKRMTSKVKVINSHYGNPYECYFQYPAQRKVEVHRLKNNREVKIKYEGRAFRISKARASELR